MACIAFKIIFENTVRIPSNSQVIAIPSSGFVIFIPSGMFIPSVDDSIISITEFPVGFISFVFKYPKTYQMFQIP